jgi:hypothetical protein
VLEPETSDAIAKFREQHDCSGDAEVTRQHGVAAQPRGRVGSVADASCRCAATIRCLAASASDRTIEIVVFVIY